MFYGVVEIALCLDLNQGSIYVIIYELNDSWHICFTFKMKLHGL